MTYKVFLPCPKIPFDEMPFHWLCWSRSEKTLKGDFTYESYFPVTRETKSIGTEIIFEEEEDMQLFILMWGEYL